jgi:hypothetical protein
MPRASGIYAALARVRPAPFAVRNFLEKALTISGVGRFTRRGGTCRLHAIFMNQLCIIWGIRRNCQARQVMERRTRRERVFASNDPPMLVMLRTRSDWQSN